MTITIETIIGKPYTVVWKDYYYGWELFNFEWAVGSLGEMVFTHASDKGDSWAATALPALPRNPKAKDARLLYRYAAEGIDIVWESIDHYEYLHFPDRMFSLLSGCVNSGITHATFNGEQVEVAIEGK